MAEQAQRRAPVEQPQSEPQPNSHAYEELRHLIVAPEQESLAAIQERLGNPERRAEDVSSVVAEAIRMRRDHGDDHALSEALAPTVQETLRESVRKDPQVLADALFPVMGPAIRKSITETLRSMIESFNEALEHSLSWRGIQWRLEAVRTGKPFAEIVLLHSLLYRVEQVFLIHRETGLVLSHVESLAVAAQSPEMVAGMLSAIQQFAHDSFNASGAGTLDRSDIGDVQIWAEPGPQCVIAAVIRGHAPESYRVALQEAVEEIQREYSSQLREFHGDSGPFRAAENRLQRLLEVEYREKPAAARKPRAAIAAGIIVLSLVLGWIGYSTYLLWEWSRFLKVLRQQPGIVVLSYSKQGGKYQIRGFRDPLAADPNAIFTQAGLDPRAADLQLAPYFSLEDEMILKRANRLLSPPSSVRLTERGGVLSAKGSAGSAWIRKFQELAPMIAGVSSINEDELQNSDVGDLESIVLTFPVGVAELDPNQSERISDAEARIRSLVAGPNEGKLTLIQIVGHTDSTGIEGSNVLLSQQRASRVNGILKHSGISSDSLQMRGAGTGEPLSKEDSEEARHLNRSVTFHVVSEPAATLH
jgi:OOP family OmpA-OmpF porin